MRDLRWTNWNPDRLYSGYFGFPPASFHQFSIISPHTDSPLVRRTSGRRLENFTQTELFRISKTHWTANYFNVVMFVFTRTKG